MSTISFIDPLDTFLETEGKVDNFTVSSKDAGQMHHTLLWRQDPEESFSDWKIVLISNGDEMDGSTETIGEQTGDVRKNDTASAEKGDDGNTNLSIETDPLPTTFHVHRNILASVSTYFRSLFQMEKHHKTNEHLHQTSTIKLHSEAIKSFPIFLDYLYSDMIGKLGFERSNAVALRHLAMYFGVDTLLQDITELILLEFRSESYRDTYYHHASLFNDEKLLQGISLHRTINKAFCAVVPGIYDTLSNRPYEFLKGDHNALSSSWRHAMTYFCVYGDLYAPDAYFTLKNAENFPDVHVTGACLTQLNGIYKLYRCGDGVGSYTNGFCFLERGENQWFFYIGYYDGESRVFKNFNLYYLISDDDYPPSTGWKSYSPNHIPAPTISLKSKKWK
jgi:hypothetical protein